MLLKDWSPWHRALRYRRIPVLVGIAPIPNGRGGLSRRQRCRPEYSKPNAETYCGSNSPPPTAATMPAATAAVPATTTTAVPATTTAAVPATTTGVPAAATAVATLSE